MRRGGGAPAGRRRWRREPLGPRSSGAEDSGVAGCCPIGRQVTARTLRPGIASRPRAGAPGASGASAAGCGGARLPRSGRWCLPSPRTPLRPGPGPCARAPLTSLLNPDDKGVTSSRSDVIRASCSPRTGPAGALPAHLRGARTTRRGEGPGVGGTGGPHGLRRRRELADRGLGPRWRTVALGTGTDRDGSGPRGLPTRPEPLPTCCSLPSRKPF